jgi:2,4-dienoyl-CoA reductase-like NADH-dependent reductase (Old Yellow Enzyme family)
VLPGFSPTRRCARASAGFDGVELHYAHAYTMASFLSATNTREDGYGGSVAERARLPLEVYGAVRAAVGSGYTVGCRMLSEECIEGGSGIDDAVFFALKFAQAGMDFLSFSRGGKFDDAKQPKVGDAVYPYTGVSGYECMPGYLSDEKGPFGRNLDATRALRRHCAMRAWQ